MRSNMFEGFSPGAFHRRLWKPLAVIAALGLLGVVLYFTLSMPSS
jgi:hypothetical protein